DALQVPAIRPHDGEERRYEHPPRQAVEADKRPENGDHNPDPAQRRYRIPCAVTEEGSNLPHNRTSFSCPEMGTGQNRASVADYNRCRVLTKIDLLVPKP